MQVLEVPGHTRGAITFVIEGNAFTGDTLFAMGCGRLFEGDPPTMWASLSKLMALPDATRIYCGHEYTQNNGRFALTLEPDNAALQARMHDGGQQRGPAAQPTVPSTMALEKADQSVPAAGSAEIRKTLGMEMRHDVAVFGEIRRRKDCVLAIFLVVGTPPVTAPTASPATSTAVPATPLAPAPATAARRRSPPSSRTGQSPAREGRRQ